MVRLPIIFASGINLSLSGRSLGSSLFGGRSLSSSGSLFGSLSSLLLSLLCSLSSTLGSNSLSLSVLNSSLSLSSGNGSLLSSISYASSLLGNLSGLSGLPGVEFCLSLLLGQGTLLNTTAQVLHKQHAFVREDALGGEGWLSASLYPVEGTLEVNVDCSRICVWIVSTDLLNILTITWRSAICNYD